MPPAFRPRFRRGTADAESAAGPAEAVDEEVDSEAGGEIGDDEIGGDEIGGGEIGGGEIGGDEIGGDEIGEWLAYELHEWSLESRVMLQQLLTVDEVVHSWQGTTLMVHASLEEKVDSLVDEVEETERAKEATSRPIGPEDDLTAFDLSEWPEALRVELVERLEQARVPHTLDTGGYLSGDSGVGDSGAGDSEAGDSGAGDSEAGDSGAGDSEAGDSDAGDSGAGDSDAGDSEAGDYISGDSKTGDGPGGDDAAGAHTEGDRESGDQDVEQGEVCDLLVREVDEERVDLVIDDLLAREEEAQFEELDGLEVNDLLSRLFVACDRLRRDPRDPDGVQGVVANTRRIARVRTPFGFSAPNWRTLRTAAAELLDLVEREDTDEDDLREVAHRLSDTLRMLI